MTTATTTQINAYTYDQLDHAAQDRVCMWINEVEYWWYEDIIDWRKEEANKRGAHIDAIYFSAGYSQGDYAAMEGQVDVIEWLCTGDASEAELGQRLQAYRDKDLIWDDMATLRDNRGWQDIVCHLQGIDADDIVEEEDGVSPEQFSRDLEQAEDYFEQSIRDFNHDTLRMLYDELDYLYSDEYIKEVCEANEYLFDEYGDLIRI